MVKPLLPLPQERPKIAFRSVFKQILRMPEIAYPTRKGFQFKLTMPESIFKDKELKELRKSIKSPKLKRKLTTALKHLRKAVKEELSLLNLNQIYKMYKIKKKGKEYVRIKLLKPAFTLAQALKGFTGWFVEIEKPTGEKIYRPIKKETDIKLREGEKARVVYSPTITGKEKIQIKRKTIKPPQISVFFSVKKEEIHEFAEILDKLREYENLSLRRSKLITPWEVLKHYIPQTPPEDFKEFLFFELGREVKDYELKRYWKHPEYVKRYLITKGKLFMPETAITFYVNVYFLWLGEKGPTKMHVASYTEATTVPEIIYEGKALIEREDLIKMALLIMKEQIEFRSFRPVTEKITIVSDEPEILSSVFGILDSIEEGRLKSGVGIYQVAVAYPTEVEA